MSGKRCETCRYWLSECRSDKGEILRIEPACNRFPKLEQREAWYPACGEHKPREGEEYDSALGG